MALTNEHIAEVAQLTDPEEIRARITEQREWLARWPQLPPRREERNRDCERYIGLLEKRLAELLGG